MINSETKRRIDSARQVLVGVVPNPTSQIDQITNALIYKFMDDIDQSSIKAGGEASFFTGNLEQYAWSKIMSERLGNQERMNLYGEALEKFAHAKQLPELFRDIFKSAYLPYRSPETLGLFLKEIEYFDYEHPEDLGDAYEYLLSIMSSQGDAGQFRTPRNIIDFIVDVVNPTKDDKVLDPACGTGGFLVSTYKHIVEQHDGKDDPKGREKPLTPEQKKKLFTNFEGYDIDPGMVRIAQVNMYLHQFKNPKILQYNSLSQEERWDDKFDVILANPPFMSPSGGVQTHKKFSIQSSRSEVLFVDYIMNHLRPKGRAGIIVPEGIIFKNDGAYKQLRKSLVEDGLYAVVSLPSGVFNPYAGVKTSILLFDNARSEETDELLFVKVENDGFDLGAQRRPINKNDLPEALKVLSAWRKGTYVESRLSQLVKKSKIAETGEYNLSASRYVSDPMEELRQTVAQMQAQLQGPAERMAEQLAPMVAQMQELQAKLQPYQEQMQKVAETFSKMKFDDLATKLQELYNQINTYPFIELSEVTTYFNDGNWVESKDQSETGIRLIQTGNIGNGDYLDKKSKSRFVSEEKFTAEGYTEIFKGDVLISRLPDPVGRACFVPQLDTRAITSVDCTIVRFDDSKMLPSFFKYLTLSNAYNKEIEQYLTGSSRKRISRSNLAKIKIPFPPLEIQKQIVEELDSYQKIIDSAKQIVLSWSPVISIKPEWSMATLGDVCEIGSSKRVFESEWTKEGVPFYRAREIVRLARDGKVDNDLFISQEMFDDYSSKYGAPAVGDIMVTGVGTLGVCYLVKSDDEFYFKDGNIIWLKNFKETIDSNFVSLMFETEYVKKQILSTATGGTVGTYTITNAKETKIPLPSLAEQKKIVEQIENERKHIESSKNLIKLFSSKIEDSVATLWT